MKQYYTYIMASKKDGILYTGVTSDLIKRIQEHKNNTYSGFTKRYLIHKLVHFEVFEDVYEALTREKRIKKWKRQWKIELIEESNPQWKDLYPGLLE